MLHYDDAWFVSSHASIPSTLPSPKAPLSGASIVPWRYNLNTVTFSYSFVWYTWEDWEKLLDWAALRGVNLQLAWVGYEKIYLDSFRELGLSDDDIIPFFSSPAFQAWNRFGNVHGTWDAEKPLSMAWIDQQFDLQKKIIARMVELGMTPVLPAFPGFVPDALPKIRPNASIIKTVSWGGFPGNTPKVSFLDPLDTTSAELQKLFVSKQIEAFGNVTNVYTLDQFNEVTPSSGEAAYLSKVSAGTYAGLEAANPAAIWMLQGWLFYSSAKFWSQERIDAYLSGPDTGSESMLVLDLFSESNPQWQRTLGYAGRPWIWCELHDFGENMALEGQIVNITANPVQALAQSKSMVGMGLTPEGYEGNEVVYDLLLDQAWSPKAIDTASYFHDWIRTRYSGAGHKELPKEVFEAWETMRGIVFNSTTPGIFQVPVSIYQLSPVMNGLVNRTGHSPHPTALHYDPAVLTHAWTLLHDAVTSTPALWDVPAFQLDFVDVARQIISNEFGIQFAGLLTQLNATSASADDLAHTGDEMMDLLAWLNRILSTTDRFRLSRWLDAAKVWGKRIGDEETIAFDARTQVTVWGIHSYLNDYAAKAWSGLTSGYFAPRYQIFIQYLIDAKKAGKGVDQTNMAADIRKFEVDWQSRGWDAGPGCDKRDVKKVVKGLMKRFPKLFA